MKHAMEQTRWRRISAALSEKDNDMSKLSWIIKPTTIVALFVFAGTVPPAAADDAVESHNAPAAEIEEASREQAKRATEKAVNEAAEAIKKETELALDIRMISRRSTMGKT